MLLPYARTCFPDILIGEGASGNGGGTTIVSVHIGKHDVWSGSIPGVIAVTYVVIGVVEELDELLI